VLYFHSLDIIIYSWIFENIGRYIFLLLSITEIWVITIFVVLDQSTVILQKGEGVTYMQEPNSQAWQKQVFDIGYTLFRQLWIKNRKKSDQTAVKLFTKCVQGNFRWVAQHCFQSVAISFSHKSPHFSLLSSTSPCELYEREVTFFSNLKVVRALKCLSEVLYICANVTKNIYQHLSFSLSLFIPLNTLYLCTVAL
jgi:hypothetical protein